MPPARGPRPGVVLRRADRRSPADGTLGRAPRRAGLPACRRRRRLINPFNGEGIAYGYETGRLAAAAVGEAIVAGDPRRLGGYEQPCRRSTASTTRSPGGYRLLSRPGVMRIFVETGMYNRPVMEWVLRIMSNYCAPTRSGPPRPPTRPRLVAPGAV